MDSEESLESLHATTSIIERRKARIKELLRGRVMTRDEIAAELKIPRTTIYDTIIKMVQIEKTITRCRVSCGIVSHPYVVYGSAHLSPQQIRWKYFWHLEECPRCRTKGLTHTSALDQYLALNQLTCACPACGWRITVEGGKGG